MKRIQFLVLLTLASAIYTGQGYGCDAQNKECIQAHTPKPSRGCAQSCDGLNKNQVYVSKGERMSSGELCTNEDSCLELAHPGEKFKPCKQDGNICTCCRPK